MEDTLRKVGVFRKVFNNHLNRNYPIGAIYKSDGLIIHIRNRAHNFGLAYFDEIGEIIKHPDFIGHNTRHLNSFELIKKYDDNIQIAIKLDNENGYWYVASVYDISQAKLERRLHSGRIVRFIDIK